MSGILIDRSSRSSRQLTLIAADHMPFAVGIAISLPATANTPQEAHLPPDSCYTAHPCITALQLLAHADAAALPTIVLAALVALLTRYTGEETVKLGFSSLPEGQPYSAPLPEGQHTLEIQRGAELSLQAIAQACGMQLYSLEENSSQTNSQPVTFAYRRTGPVGASYPGAIGDLHLELIDAPNARQLRWIYRPERVSAAAIARMEGHLAMLLASALIDMQRPISHLPLLTDTELRQTAAWNATDAPYPEAVAVHSLFEWQALLWPDALALTFEGSTMSYGELDRRANQLAHFLHRHGAGPEAIIGLAIERSPLLIIAILAVLKAGAAYLPLDPDYPADRLAFMLSDAQAAFLLTTDATDIWATLAPRLSATGYQPAVMYLEQEARAIEQEIATYPPVTVSPGQLAYVIYTSGSTGLPKGTLLEHRGLCNLVAAQRAMFKVHAGDRILQFATINFDASVWEWAMALCNGATLCLARQGTLLSESSLLQLLREERITIATLPPALLSILPPDGLPDLATVITAGEACSADLVARWAPGRRFFNAYGPTETTVCASWYQCNPLDVGPPAIGRPLPNMRLLVLDQNQQPVPIGIPGELYIGGFPLARGYLNRPELTAERFVVWAGAGLHGGPRTERLYRTGDRVRYREDGNLEFLGRMDQQIKLRGYRIELHEIDAVLRRHPAVLDSVVVVHKQPAGLQRLVAYVVAEQAQPGTLRRIGLQDELQTLLREKLPEFMVPSAFVFLSRLPLTPNNKVDRRALPDPQSYEESSPFAAPHTDTEAMLARIWAQVLQREHVGVNDDFFALGGHSLLAGRLIALVNEATQRTLPLRLLYEAPTVRAFALALRGDNMQPVGHERIDLRAEAMLDPSIAPSAELPIAPHDMEPRAIFLTGATGFLGAFLLCELLERTRADIYCLVRAASDQEAATRITNTLEAYHIDVALWSKRIVPIAGDLRIRSFGLSDQRFQELAATIDQIYHAGAYVHYLHPYAALKPTNVNGTAEVLRFACSERVKPVHYISTIAVAMASAKHGRLYEDAPLGDCLSNHGYDQSKWVSEVLVRTAGERGLPVTIYRPSRIIGHSQTGAVNLDDFLVRLLADCVDIGMAPTIPMLENLITVDFTARAIVALSRQPSSLNHTFHLVNPQPTTWSWIIDAARQAGYHIELAPYDRWRSTLKEQMLADADHLLHSSLNAQANQTTEAQEYVSDLARYTFDTMNVYSSPEASALHVSEIDPQLIARILQGSVKRHQLGAQAI